MNRKKGHRLKDRSLSPQISLLKASNSSWLPKNRAFLFFQIPQGKNFPPPPGEPGGRGGTPPPGKKKKRWNCVLRSLCLVFYDLCSVFKNRL